MPVVPRRRRRHARHTHCHWQMWHAEQLTRCRDAVWGQVNSETSGISDRTLCLSLPFHSCADATHPRSSIMHMRMDSKVRGQPGNKRKRPGEGPRLERRRPALSCDVSAAHTLSVSQNMNLFGCGTWPTQVPHGRAEYELKPPTTNDPQPSAQRRLQ